MYTFQEHLLHLQLAARSEKWIWLKEEYFSVEIQEFQHHIILNIFTLKTTVLCGCYQIYYSLLHLMMTAITNLPLNAEIQLQVAVPFLVHLKWKTEKMYLIAVWFVSSYQLNAHFLYSITIYKLHYNPQHVSSSTLLIFRRTNCIITASGIVTLCKRLYREWRYQRL